MKKMYFIGALIIGLLINNSLLAARTVQVYTEFSSTATGFSTCPENDRYYNYSLHYTAGPDWGWGRFMQLADICIPLPLEGKGYIPNMKPGYEQYYREIYGYSYAHYVPGIQLVKYQYTQQGKTTTTICILRPSEEPAYFTINDDAPYKDHQCYILTRVVDSKNGLSGDPSLDPTTDDSKWKCAFPPDYPPPENFVKNSPKFKIIKNTINEDCPLANDENQPDKGYYNDWQLPYSSYCECSSM